MTTDTKARLQEKLSESAILHASSLPDEAEVDSAARKIGVPFDHGYREFLLLFGGAMVGPFPIFGLRPVEVMGSEWSVIAVTEQCRDDRVPGSKNWVIISEDHAGNPIGMDGEGVIWIHDHDFGGISRIADSFEEYVRVYCLKLPAAP
jgi:hypothetical protein